MCGYGRRHIEGKERGRVGAGSFALGGGAVSGRSHSCRTRGHVVEERGLSQPTRGEYPHHFLAGIPTVSASPEPSERHSKR